MQLKVKKLHPDARVPSYANPGDAGMDIYAVSARTIKPNEIALIDTGIACELPEGCVGLVWDKSSVSTKRGLKVMGGVIDEGYRGELKIGLINLSGADCVIEQGDKVAQLLVQKVERAHPQVVEDLSDSVRGEGGFGSTGRK